MREREVTMEEGEMNDKGRREQLRRVHSEGRRRGEGGVKRVKTVQDGVGNGRDR